MNESSTHKKRIKRFFLTCSGSAGFSSMIWQDIFQDVWHMDVSFPDDGLSSTVDDQRVYVYVNWSNGTGFSDL